MTSIIVSKPPYQLSARLYAPEAPTTNYSPAVIVVPPSNAVKEQFPSTYARLLSRRPHNFYTVCYDPSHFGASGGNPRYLEDPNARISDICAIIDYLMKEVRRVDKKRIGLVGVCTGGGYAIAAAKKDWRIKAVATISLVNIGDWFRIGWEGREPVEKRTESMRNIADERTKELRMRPLSSSTVMSGVSLSSCVISLPSTPIDARRSLTPTFDNHRRCSTPTSPGFRDLHSSVEEEMGKVVSFIPGANDETLHPDLQELTDYYTTPRAYHPRAENKLLQESLPLILTFDAFDFVEAFLKVPVFCMIGGAAGSRWHTDRLDIMLRRGSKTGIRGVEKLVVVESARHTDFFDGFEEIDKALEDIGVWMREKLTSLK